MTYDEVTSWRSDALKLYCRQRGLKVSGSKQELVARVFDFTPGIVYFHYTMSTSCIHVTPLLFWIEAANRNGLTGGGSRKFRKRGLSPSTGMKTSLFRTCSNKVTLTFQKHFENTRKKKKGGGGGGLRSPRPLP